MKNPELERTIAQFQEISRMAKGGTVTIRNAPAMTAYQEIVAAAEQLREHSDVALTTAEAIVKVCELNPSLYAKYRQQRAEGVPQVPARTPVQKAVRKSPAWDAIQQEAAELVKVCKDAGHPISLADAVATTVEARPELYEAYRQERRRRTGG